MTYQMRWVDFTKVQRAGDRGVLMMRFAMAVNDLQSANFLLTQATTLGNNKATTDMVMGVRLYGIRLAIGHLAEAMLLLRHERDNNTPDLWTEYNLDNPGSYVHFRKQLLPAQDNYFTLLKEMLPGGSEATKFEKLVENFRHRLFGHYDTGYRGRNNAVEPPVVKTAIDLLASRGQNGTMVLGEDINKTRFIFADDVVNVAGWNAVWGIDPTLDRNVRLTEADAISGWIQDRMIAFMGFAGPLCEMYFSTL